MTSRRSSSRRSSGRFTPPGTSQPTPPRRPCRCPACEQGASFDPAAEWQRMRSMVERVGHCIQYVDAGGIGFPWAYTIGRIAQELPELVVTGTDPESAAYLLNELAAVWSDLQPASGGVVTLPGPHRHRCKLVAVPDGAWDGEYLMGAQHYAEDEGLVGRRSALQVLWPDPSGRFPDDPGASMRTVRLQPIISRLPFRPG